MVSIIIVTYNSAEHIGRCLLSVFDQPFRDLEVIVIDNRSEDETPQILKAWQKKGVRVVFNPENVGFARACNQGIRLSSGDTILLLNPDTVVLDNAIGRCQDFLMSTPDAGIVGCQIRNEDGSIQKSCRYDPSIGILLSRALGLYRFFPKSHFFGRVYMSHFNYQTTREVDAVSGAFLMFKRLLAEQIGPLDDRYFMYTEEVDFCYRARQAGWKVYFYADARIIHQLGHTAFHPDRDAQLFLQQHRSNALFFKKFYPPLHQKLFRLIGTAEMALRYLYWTVKNGIRPSLRNQIMQHRYRQTFLWYLFGYGKDLRR